MFISFYNEAKKTAIANLNEEQMIHAKQAAHALEEFFTTWTSILSSFARMEEIIDTDATGKRNMDFFLEAHKEQIRSITRVDENGVILYTVPFKQSIGSNISSQPHMQKILKDHKPVLSDVFKAVQGFDAVALHVPVSKGDTFKGTIAIVINFESLATRYLEVIKLGKTGNVWMINQNGTILYHHFSGFIGKNIFEAGKDFQSILDMANKMIRGEHGQTTYISDKLGEQTVASLKKHAVYMPILIADTFWSIVVSSTEEEVLSSLISFRNKLIMIIVMILTGGVSLTIIGAKAWLIVAEEEKRKKAEKELRLSEQRYRELFEQNPAPMLIYQRDSLKLLAVNEAFTSHYGYSRHGSLALHLPDLYPDEEKGLITKLALRLKGHAYVGEWHHIKADGKVINIVARSHDIDYLGNEARIAVITDITEMKNLEAALRASEIHFRESLEFLTIPIGIIDRNGEITFLNHEFTRHFGYTREDIPTIAEWALRSYPNLAYRQQFFAQWNNDLEQAIKNGTVTPIREYRITCYDGKQRDVEIVLRHIGNFSVTSFNDVTERKHTEEELRKLNETLDQKVHERIQAFELQNQELIKTQKALQYLLKDVNEANTRLKELDRLKSLFIASMSHELRTPLNSIIGFTGILIQGLAGPLNDEQRKQLGMVKGSSQHLLDLITDIIDLSKIEAGKISLSAEDFDLAKTARDVLESFRVAADRKSIALVAETPVQIMALSDSRRVRQVLVNLIGNAVKFTDKGQVSVFITVEGHNVLIKVQDTGPGIKPEDMGKLFKFFSQITSPEMVKHEGTGLGLYLSKKLMNLLGGDIQAESEFGKGSVFIVTLPIKKVADEKDPCD